MSDLINRQDAIDAISTWDKFGIDDRNRVVRWYEGLEPYVKLRDVVWAIEKLPSVERKGKWSKVSATRYTQSADYFYRCSECGGCQVGALNFCPHCGADMRGEEDAK